MSTVRPNSGLNKINHDRSKDWSHKKNFGSTNTANLPSTLGRIRMAIEDQDFPVPTDFCTGYSKSKALAYMRGIEMSPEWQVAIEGKYLGEPILDGADPKSAMDAAVLNGALPKQFAHLSLEKDGAIKISDWRNWGNELAPIALPQAPSGWYAVADDDGDTFDDIRIALYKAWTAEDRAPVMADGEWFREWNDAANNPHAGGYMPAPITDPIALHDYLFIDWITIQGTPYLVAHLSQGTDFGDKGFLYFDRPTINMIWSQQRMLKNGTGLYIFRSKGNRLPALIRIGLDLVAHARALLKLLAYYS